MSSNITFEAEAFLLQRTKTELDRHNINIMTSSESEPHPLVAAIAKFEAGYAKEAALFMQQYAFSIAQQADLPEHTNQHSRAKSDRVAELGIRMVYCGDSSHLQETARQRDVWNDEQKKLQRDWARLLQLLSDFENLLMRMLPLIEELPLSCGWYGRLRQDNFYETILRGVKHNLTTDQLNEYMLGPIREDIAEFVNYVYCCKSRGDADMIRPAIREGHKHEFLASLLELDNHPMMLEEITKLQERILEGQKRPSVSDPFWCMTEHEQEIRSELYSLKRQEIDLIEGSTERARCK